MELLRFLSTVICVVFITTGAVSGVDVKKAVGGEVSFRPDSFVPPVTSIIWKQINTAGNVTVKAIEWDEGEILIPNPRFQGITKVDEKTGQITIANLKVEHSGVYTIDINSKEQQQRFTLTVMEGVPKPKIKIEPTANPNVVYLSCEYSEKIIWKNSAGEILPGSKHDAKGESITVIKNGDPETFYTCTLKNAVSEETSDPVYESDLFTEDSIVPAIVGAIFGVFIFIIIIIIVLYLVLESFHEYVNTHCSCIKSRKLDCFLKKAKAEEQSTLAVAPVVDTNGKGTTNDKESKETDQLKQENEKADQQQQQ